MESEGGINGLWVMVKIVIFIRIRYHKPIDRKMKKGEKHKKNTKIRKKHVKTCDESTRNKIQSIVKSVNW